MSNSSTDWANLDSANERVMGATELAGESPTEAQPGPAFAPEPSAATESQPGSVADPLAGFGQ